MHACLRAAARASTQDRPPTTDPMPRNAGGSNPARSHRSARSDRAAITRARGGPHVPLLRRTGPAEVGGAELVGPAAQSVWSEITNRTHHSDTTRFVHSGLARARRWRGPYPVTLKPKSMSGFYNPRLFHQVLVSFDLVLFDSIHPRVIVYGHRNVIAHDLLASDSFFSFP
jgi:hypothetical protein